MKRLILLGFAFGMIATPVVAQTAEQTLAGMHWCEKQYPQAGSWQVIKCNELFMSPEMKAKIASDIANAPSLGDPEDVIIAAEAKMDHDRYETAVSNYNADYRAAVNNAIHGNYFHRH